MPNHVTNRIVFKADQQIVDAFLSTHFTANEEELNFDFETIIPQPSILKGTHASYGTSLQGDERNRLAYEETGHYDWYSWNTSNWGTKWNAYHTEIDNKQSDGMLTFKFDTAWSVPVPVLNKLSEMYPNSEILVDSFDEGWCFVFTAVFKNGQWTQEDFVPETGDKKSISAYEKVYGKKYTPWDEDEDEE